jgi:predicted AlkP superfamily phosphohydrolase/phosphomutase
MTRARKAAIIGIDSVVPGILEKLIQEDRLPTFKCLVESGVYAESLPQIPTYTPTNWASISTGATTATHGIAAFCVPLPPKDEEQASFAKRVWTSKPDGLLGVSGFDSTVYTAEQLWSTAERHGKRSIILGYPGCWPPNIKKGIVALHGVPLGSPFIVEDAGAYTNIERLLSRFRQATYSAFGSYQFQGLARELNLSQAKGWKNLPKSSLPPLQADFSITQNYPLDLLVFASSKRGYDRVLVTKGKDARKPLSNLGVGDWSDYVIDRFRVEGKAVKASYRFKLLELSPDATRILLWRTQVHWVDNIAFPKPISKLLIDHCGPFIDNPRSFLISERYWDTYFEELQYHCDWLVNALDYLSSKNHWDLFLTKIHSPDEIQHELWYDIDPKAVHHNPAKYKESWKTFVDDYQIMDRTLARFLNILGKDTVVAVASDHGQFAHNRRLLLANALVDAGLVTLRSDGSPDWSKTKVWVNHICHLFVNVKGRRLFFDGSLVNPGEEYEQVRDQLITALRGIRDPQTGAHPISVALRREDAGFLGLNGPTCGDVLYTCDAGYQTHPLYVNGATDYVVEPPSSYQHVEENQFSIELQGTHGEGLPDASLSLGTIKGIFIMSGPGVKRGFKRPKAIEAIDIAPTVAHLMGLPPPRDAEGSLVQDFLA